MASVNGVNYAKTADPTSSNILDRAVVGGNVKVMFDTYEAASLASGTTIKVGKDLQDGVRILDVWVITDDMGVAGCTISVGDSDTADRYISATSVGSASRFDLDTIGGFGYEIGTNDGDNTILLTTGTTSTTGLQTGTIKVAVLYSES
jgi:hypothetical protein